MGSGEVAAAGATEMQGVQFSVAGGGRFGSKVAWVAEKKWETQQQKWVPACRFGAKKSVSQVVDRFKNKSFLFVPF